MLSRFLSFNQYYQHASILLFLYLLYISSFLSFFLFQICRLFLSFNQYYHHTSILLFHYLLYISSFLSFFVSNMQTISQFQPILSSYFYTSLPLSSIRFFLLELSRYLIMSYY
jgi:hypothetical protein